MTQNGPGLFGELLQRLRASAALSQEELAERAALSRRGISDLERGRRRAPHPSTVRRLAAALDLLEAERSALLGAARMPDSTTAASREGSNQGSLSQDLPVQLTSLAGPGQETSVVHVVRPMRSPSVLAAEQPEPKHNLPSQVSSFIGRTEAITELRSLLVSARLITLTGPGGIGKTRLALAVAHNALPDYTDGVWLVELAALADVTLVAPAVASVLDIPHDRGSLPQHLARVLRSKTVLIVLDNCEQVVRGCAELADSLLRACPGVQILATSREHLDVVGEIIWGVPGLTTPEPNLYAPAASRQVQTTEAERLFVERAQAASGFCLTAHNSAAVADVCRQLSGIPLAIELAARRTQVLTAHEIAFRLADPLKVLIGGSRTAPTRQQTLRAALDWSYDLLPSSERTLFNRLSVFVGGCTLEAVEALCQHSCSADVIRADDVLELISRLVAQSLVAASIETIGMRYRLLQPVHQYARERLDATHEKAEIRTRHRDWCLALAQAARLGLIGPDQRAWLDRLEREHDNLRAALEFSLEHASDATPALLLAAALHWFWWRRGHVSEGRDWLARTLALDARLGTSADVVTKGARMLALKGAGILARAQGDFADAERSFAASVSLARELGDAAALADGLYWVGYCATYLGRSAAAREQIEQSLALWREIGDPWGMSFPLGSLAYYAEMEGDYAAATTLHQERLRLACEAGDVRIVANAYTHLGRLAYEQARFEQANELLEMGRRSFEEAGDSGDGLGMVLSHSGRAARASGDALDALRRFSQSLVLFHKLEAMWGIAECFDGLAGALCDLHQFEGAARLMGSAAALRATRGLQLPARDLARQQRDVTTARNALGAARFDSLAADAERQPIDAAIADGLIMARAPFSLR